MGERRKPRPSKKWSLRFCQSLFLLLPHQHLGLADIQTGKKDKPHQFVCLIGEKGKVLLTFFTEK